MLILALLVALGTGLFLIAFSHVAGVSPLSRPGVSWQGLVDAYQGSQRRSDIVVSCTTMPSGFPRLRRMLASVLALQPPPAEIFVNIPETCLRTGEPYSVPEWLSQGPFTLLERVPDTGPSTKYLPTLLHLREYGDQRVLVVDDDANLHPRTLAFLEQSSERFPGCALTCWGKQIPESQKTLGRYEFGEMVSVYPERTWKAWFEKYGFTQQRIFLSQAQESLAVDIIMGHASYLVQPDFFNLEELADYGGLPPEAAYVDDIVISGMLARRQVPKLVVNGWPMNKKELVATGRDFADQMLRSSRSTALHNTVNRTEHNNNTMLEFFGSQW